MTSNSADSFPSFVSARFRSVTRIVFPQRPIAIEFCFGYTSALARIGVSRRFELQPNFLAETRRVRFQWVQLRAVRSTARCILFAHQSVRVAYTLSYSATSPSLHYIRFSLSSSRKEKENIKSSFVVSALHER